MQVQKSTNVHITYTVVSIRGHRGFSRVTLIAVNGICSAKDLCKPNLFKERLSSEVQLDLVKDSFYDI